jgi:hypothetical protein
MCQYSQHDLLNRSHVTSEKSNMPGAYIQDTGEAQYQCPVADFTNLYMLLFVEEHYNYTRDFTSTPNIHPIYGWNVANFRAYRDGDTYEHGTVQPHGDYTSDDIEETKYYALCVNLNNQRIEIDQTEDDGDYFYVTDSVILDYFGTPVYMYGYVRGHYNDDTGYWDAVYTRYGYFMNGVHYRSQAFEPAGVGGERVYCLHDVYGSVNREGTYGFGQCAGFAVKRTKRDTQTIEQ